MFTFSVALISGQAVQISGQAVSIGQTLSGQALYVQISGANAQLSGLFVIADVEIVASSGLQVTIQSGAPVSVQSGIYVNVGSGVGVLVASGLPVILASGTPISVQSGISVVTQSGIAVVLQSGAPVSVQSGSYVNIGSGVGVLVASGLYVQISGQGVAVASGLAVILQSGAPVSIQSGSFVNVGQGAAQPTKASGNIFAINSSGTQFPNSAGARHLVKLLASGVVFVAGDGVNSGVGYMLAGDPTTQPYGTSLDVNLDNLNRLYGISLTSGHLATFLSLNH